MVMAVRGGRHRAGGAARCPASAMRVALTVDIAGRRRDVLVECEPTTPLADLEREVSATFGVPVLLGAGMAGEALMQACDLSRRGHSMRGKPSHSLHIVGGPDAGVILPLKRGRQEVGRGAHLTWNDPALPRRAMALTVGDGGASFVSLSSGMALDGEPCERNAPVALAPERIVQVGESRVVVRERASDAAVVESAGPGWQAFLRPPRIRSPRSASVIQFPEPPSEGVRRRVPVVAATVPAAIGLAMAFLLRSPMYVAFALMGPITVLASYAADRRGAAKDYRTATKAYREALEEAEQSLVDEVDAEQCRLREDQPDPAATLVTARGPGRRLWERRLGDLDGLRLRVGLGEAPLSAAISGPIERLPRLRDVPQVLSLREHPVMGVVGPEPAADAVLRWAIAQLVVHHAPRDLKLVFLTAEGGTEWSWLHWLPHCRPTSGEECAALIGNDQHTVRARLHELASLIRRREEQKVSHPSIVVVAHGFRALRQDHDLMSVVASGPAVGVQVICTDATETALPEHTSAFLRIHRDQPARGTLTVNGAEAVEFLADRVSVSYAEQVARSLSPFKDTSDASVATLPERARLLDLLGLEPLNQDALRSRWAREPASTAVVLGAGVGGPATFDLKADGPHVLVAGMTGSGKSELLQTMIASLAVANRPEWLNFVLVDYKGDSAFQDCVDLPHTVGKVTDLDPFLVQRALVSLNAELDGRKKVLADAGVKDIDDYHDLLRLEPGRSPLPRLVIVIDEFAELANELPDFIEGLVSIAQTGRSLGVHLVLATQRPSGVVSPSIRANTNVRIALRVPDAGDSIDVLNSPDAAKIPKSSPGRGFARIGANSLLAFQAGRVGGRSGARVIEPTAPFVALLEWKALGYPPPQRATVNAQEDAADTDLARLVATLRAAATAENIPQQRKPWLEPLPSHLLWSNDGLPAPEGRGLSPLPFGRSDIPASQRQVTATFDVVRDGHLFIVGSPGSGRSQVLRALAASIASLVSPADLHLYGLDCGTGALAPMTSLPHCGAVVSRAEVERALRLLGRLSSELDARQQKLAGGGFGDISEQRRCAPDPMPHIVFMLDRWESFTPVLGELDGPTDTILRLLREGASAGIHLVITGDRSLITNSRMSTMTDNKFALKLAEKSDYFLVGFNGKMVPDKLPAGRCYGPGMLETQVFLLSDDASGQGQARALQELGAATAQPSAGPRPFRVDALPSRITLEEAQRLPGGSSNTLVMGVGGDELTALGPDVTRSSSFIVAGPSRSGRSSVLLSAARSALAQGSRVVVVAPRPSPLRELAGQPGAAVVTTGITTDALEDAVASVHGSRVLIVVDDGESLRDSPADDFFMRLVRGLVPNSFLVLGGQADGLALGLTGWQVEATKARQGLLLSPQSITDGDLIGARLPRQVIGHPVRLGAGLLHLGDGALVPIATVAP